MAAAWAAKTMFTSGMFIRIGAEIDAPVIIATVPEPWLKRIHQVLESAQLDVRDEEAGDRIFSVSISPVVNSGYVNIYALDITERKRAEEQVTRQLDELRRWQTVTLGREGRVAELKREVNALAVRLGQPPPYPSAEAT